MTEKEQIARKLVKRYMCWSAAGALIPIPGPDIAVITGAQLKMLAELSKIYDVPFEKVRVKAIFGSLMGKSRRFKPDLLRRAVRRLEYVDLATCIEDLKTPPSNRLHSLKDDRSGQHAISINDQWRICFRFVDGDAYDVEIADYH